jgi:hypothetical protein
MANEHDGVVSPVPDIRRTRGQRVEDTPALVAVYWDDAHSYSDELEISELKHHPVTIITYGLLVKDNEMGVTVSNEQTDPHSFRGHTFIPRGLIQKITVIRKKPFKHPGDK